MRFLDEQPLRAVDPAQTTPSNEGKGGFAMLGLLVVKPLLLLGGAGYLGYRLFYKPIKSLLDAQRNDEFAKGGGINMKRCPECNTYIRGDAPECPSCQPIGQTPGRKSDKP
jgi:hypothetical protein